MRLFNENSHEGINHEGINRTVRDRNFLLTSQPFSISKRSFSALTILPSEIPSDVSTVHYNSFVSPKRVELAPGLEKEIVQRGDERSFPGPGDQVFVHYTGWVNVFYINSF